MTNAQRLFGQRDDLHLMGTREAAARGADALIVATDWHEFKVLDYAALRSLLKHPLVIDGRNLYQPERMAEEGFTYYGIGRQLFNGKPAAHQRQQ